MEQWVEVVGSNPSSVRYFLPWKYWFFFFSRAPIHQNEWLRTCTYSISNVTKNILTCEFFNLLCWFQNRKVQYITWDEWLLVLCTIIPCVAAAGLSIYVGSEDMTWTVIFAAENCGNGRKYMWTPQEELRVCHQGPLILTCFNFHLTMDMQS